MERSGSVEKSWPSWPSVFASAGWIRQGFTTSPKVCSTLRLLRSNMWAPTRVGRVAKSAKVTRRTSVSGSSTMSSSQLIT